MFAFTMAQSGEIQWSVIETVSGKELAGGQLSLENCEVKIDKHLNSEGLTCYRKRIPLFGPFSFAIDEHPCRCANDIQGFGFRAEKEDHNTFSWEWFNVQSPTEAVKLQEDGKLGIQFGEAGCGWEVSRTDFLTDVSLRITRFDGDPALEPYWRVVIREGSWISWPEAE